MSIPLEIRQVQEFSDFAADIQQVAVAGFPEMQTQSGGSVTS
jgi:hypothetical protein